MDTVVKTAYLVYFAILALAAVLFSRGHGRVAVALVLLVIAAHWLLSLVSLVRGDDTITDRYNFRCAARATTALFTDTLFVVASVGALLWAVRGVARHWVYATIAVAVLANLGCVQLRFRSAKRCL
uniref:Uncharacterized protein n=1 Tax=viral metagenome TaxID=1070528 RepID=A0A6C0KBL1_9ZZZZ